MDKIARVPQTRDLFYNLSIRCASDTIEICFVYVTFSSGSCLFVVVVSQCAATLGECEELMMCAEDHVHTFPLVRSDFSGREQYRYQVHLCGSTPAFKKPQNAC